MSNLKPINTGNAKNINEICSPLLKLSMIRYEALFDFYSEEPSSINVQINEGEDKYKLEQIIRIRRWGNNTESYSFSVYSNNREWDYNLNNLKTAKNIFAIRQVIWDMNKDIERIKTCPHDIRQKLINSWPSIYSTNICVESRNVIKLKKWISDIDEIVKQGILLEPNSCPTWDWRNVEFKRLFDWGGIQSTWSPIKANVQLEVKIEEFKRYFTITSSNENFKVNLIDLDYSIKPEVFKNSISGDIN